MCICECGVWKRLRPAVGGSVFPEQLSDIPINIYERHPPLIITYTGEHPASDEPADPKPHIGFTNTAHNTRLAFFLLSCAGLAVYGCSCDFSITI